jgi:hypothetical protein
LLALAFWPWTQCSILQKNNHYLLNHTAVFDCASLIYLSRLHNQQPFFELLRNVFKTLYFPTEVIKEFAKGCLKEQYRNWILKRLRPETGLYRLCTTYDSIVLASVENVRGINRGEAEAYAQLRKVNARFIISDDKAFTNSVYLLDPCIKVYNSLHIICMLHFNGCIANWPSIIRQLHAVRPFGSKDLRAAFTDVARDIGLSFTKKEVSEKCSLKKIL